MTEMTYAQFVERLPELLSVQQEYEDWRQRTRMFLLTNLAPRIAKLSTQFYTGCGFHYGLEQDLGKAIIALALPEQFTAAHCATIPAQRVKMIINKVLVETLTNSVVKAERTVSKP